MHAWDESEEELSRGEICIVVDLALVDLAIMD